MRTFALLCLIATGCGPKDETTTAAPAQAASARPDVPDDDNSGRFATALVAMNISNFRPMSAGSGRFVYNTLSFEGDNTWRADGFIEIAGETLDCTESGTWSMEPAESAAVAVMTWSVAETDCLNQTAGDRRYRITIQGNELRAEYR